ncbi:MAG: hypothetical protein NT051_04100 [Candidatus Micrarchaeota archaeon]|nr:hypothetical protein [Candidatus Micrarchaeota archaeon]
MAKQTRKTDNWDNLLSWIKENDKKFKGKKKKIDHDLICYGVNRNGNRLLPNGKARRKR